MPTESHNMRHCLFFYSTVVSRFIPEPSFHSSAAGHWCYFHILAIMNNEHLCTRFCVYIYFQFSWIHTCEWILCHMVTLCLMFGEIASFPKQLHHFIFLPAKSESSNTVHIFHHSCHSGCEMPTHCSFDLHFPSEKGMATHSSILAWRTLWTEDPGRLQSMWLQRVR